MEHLDSGGHRLYLVGFRIEPDIFDPHMYTIYVDDDRPILSEGRPILFPRFDLAAIALSKSDCGASMIGPAPSELYAVFDIAAAIYTLNEKDEESSNEVLNVLNIILDFVNCTKEKMPASYRRALEMLADHLTFNPNFAEFFDGNIVSRNKVTNAIYWSLGMILYNSRIVVG
jgi:hypothetical protein